MLHATHITHITTCYTAKLYDYQVYTNACVPSIAVHSRILLRRESLSVNILTEETLDKTENPSRGLIIDLSRTIHSIFEYSRFMLVIVSSKSRVCHTSTIVGQHSFTELQTDDDRYYTISIPNLRALLQHVRAYQSHGTQRREA